MTEHLLVEGHEALVIDNLSCGHRDAVEPNAQFVELDLNYRDGVARALTQFRADTLVHMVGVAMVGESAIDPAKYYFNNVTAGVSRFDFLSTATVYGNAGKQPIEEGDPLNPTNVYGETKLAFERILAAYGLSSVSLRYFKRARRDRQTRRAS